MRFLALGEFFVNIANAILLLGFAKFLFDETGQLWAFSLAFIIEMILAFFIPIFAGRVIDTKGVKNILRGVSAANVIICLVYTTLVSDTEISVLFLLLTSMALSTVKLVIKLSVFSLTPELTEDQHLEKNNGWLATAFQGGQLLGMACAAVLLSIGSLSTLFAFVSVFFLLAWVCYTLATRGVKSQSNCDKTKELSTNDGKQYGIKQLFKVSRNFAPMLLISNLDFTVVALFNLLLATTVANLFGNDPKWLSILDGIFAFAALVGGMLVAKKWRRSSIADSIRTQIFFIACLVILLLPTVKYLLIICVFGFGLSLSMSTVFWNTRLQRNFPAEHKGSLAGARNLISSVYIGVCSIIVSFFHETGFTVAVIVCITITFVHLACLLAFNLKDGPNSNISPQGNLL